MIIKKMLQVLEYVNKLNIRKYDTLEHYFGTVVYDKANINIIYLLNNKIYVGNGYIIEDKSEIKNKLNKLQSYRINHITYTSKPVYVTDLTKKEINPFIDLIKHEQKRYGNIKFSKSYAEYIKNSIPYLVDSYNDYGAVFPYDLRDIIFCTDGKYIEVALCIDNTDMEQYEYFLIPYSDKNIEDLKKIGKFDKYDTNVWYDNIRLIKL